LLRTIDVPVEAAGQRLDQFLAAQLEGVSRSRVQLLMEQGDVLVNGEQEKASMKLRGGERIAITGEPHPAPLRAIAEDIPLDVVFEDADLAVVNKPAGMMVHAGSGQNEDARNRGTLVNALLYRFKKLSSTGGDLRPGIVHRLDKGHQRPDRGGQERPRSRGPGRDVCQPPDQEDLHRAGRGRRGAREGHHQRRGGPRSGAAHPHDHQAPGECSLGRLALRGGPATSTIASASSPW
jgi:ribosome-associated protein YbcJ (S4-like RNA binding protein)